MIEALANHLWQSTLFAILIGGLCMLLRKNGAHLRYWLWFTASLKFLIPFSAIATLSQRVGEATTPIVVPERWSIVAATVAEPMASTESAISWPPLLLALWAAGFGVVIGRTLVHAGLLCAAVRRGDRAMTAGRWSGFAVDIVRTDTRLEPGIVGFLRPVLLLPEGIESRLSPEQLDAIIAHETFHVRRRDNLTAAAHMFVEALFWFFPVVWWIGRRLVDERERACDEMVVASGYDSRAYAEGILTVCEHCIATPIRCAAGISGSDLKKRLRNIVTFEGSATLHPGRKLLLSLVGAAVIAVPLLPGCVSSNPRTVSANFDACVRFPGVAGFVSPGSLAPVDGVQPDRGYLPIVKVAPIYPPRARRESVQGYAIVEYTVDVEGATRDVRVVETSSSLFDLAVAASAEKYKYRPCVIDGRPVNVRGVRTKVVFRLEGIEGPAPDGPSDDGMDVITVTG